MNAPQDLNAAIAPLGTLLAGGILIARYFPYEKPFALILAPKAEGEFPLTVWNTSTKKVEGAENDFDGLTNTHFMIEAGSPLAQKIGELRIAGFDDWYLPSRGELLLAWSARKTIPEAERFEEDAYWSSTQPADDSSCAWVQTFSYGSQISWRKYGELLARAVRRVAI
jgi:hypothetical protein